MRDDKYDAQDEGLEPVWDRLEDMQDQIDELHEEMGFMAEATQAQADADTQAIEQVGVDLAAAVQTVQMELNATKQANPGIDLSRLEAAIIPLDAHAKAVGNLVPETATPVAPPATPVQPPATPVQTATPVDTATPVPPAQTATPVQTATPTDTATPLATPVAGGSPLVP